MGGAQTGTGKTAGFTLPLLQRLAPHANTSASPARHPVRALILTPTRELAAQVAESVRDYGKHLRCVPAWCSAASTSSRRSRCCAPASRSWWRPRAACWIMCSRRPSMLGQVEILVLDEADRMLDMGFMPRHPPHPRAAAGEAAEPAVFGHVLRRDQAARRQPAAAAGADRSRPAQRHDRTGEPRSAPGQARAKSATCSPTWCARQNCSRCWCSAARASASTACAYQLQKDGIHAAAIHGDKIAGGTHSGAGRFQGRQGLGAGRDRRRRARPGYRGTAAW